MFQKVFTIERTLWYICLSFLPLSLSFFLSPFFLVLRFARQNKGSLSLSHYRENTYKTQPHNRQSTNAFTHFVCCLFPSFGLRARVCVYVCFVMSRSCCVCVCVFFCGCWQGECKCSSVYVLWFYFSKDIHVVQSNFVRWSSWTILNLKTIPSALKNFKLVQTTAHAGKGLPARDSTRNSELASSLKVPH